ncbi:GNAT family N-acetyltransferase [Streptomyces sp. NPDC058867]|uniref:GNAT family N-acetyltransferase n=1 Tax=unclassified Streptomyces TaxID=2593676 RepID=UPI003684D8B0
MEGPQRLRLDSRIDGLPVPESPSRRGRGLGSALGARLLKTLAERCFKSVIALIALPNEPSARQHEALGYTACGTLKAVGFKHGSWHDVGYWQHEFDLPTPPLPAGPVREN